MYPRARARQYGRRVWVPETSGGDGDGNCIVCLFVLLGSQYVHELV